MKVVAALLSASLLAGTAAAEEFVFDASEFDKKPFEFNGYLEQKLETLKLRGDSPAYRLAYPEQDARDWLHRSTSTLELSGKANYAAFVADARTQASYQRDALLSSSNYGRIMEGGLRWSASPSLTLDVGKRVQRWGKGYAWSPVGFVERPKDPADPSASREGFVMASSEWTRTFDGPVSALTLSGLLLPTYGGVNEDFGQKARLNPAAKLYLLAWGTDIDVMWRAEGARPQSLGVDFSRNLTPALEVHGEWARSFDVSKNLVSATGGTSTRTANLDSYLLGMRYLSSSEITWIAEYYRNGAGYSADQLDDYYRFLDQATASDASPAINSKARSLAQSAYGRANPGRDYLYLKASVSEPLGWLYGSTSLTAMTNLDDGSWQIQPEVAFSGFANMELRARVIIFGGQPNAEFTSKSTSLRLEAYARWFF